MPAELVIRLIGSTALFAAGGIALKLYADIRTSAVLCLSILLYSCGCYVFAAILTRGLGFAMVLATMLELSAMVIIGALFFGERLGTPKMVGLAFAMGAMIMFSLPDNTA